jgi:gluconolactonase
MKMPTATLVLGSVALFAAPLAAAPPDAVKNPAAAALLAPAVKSLAAPYPTFGTIERLDPALDKLIPPDAKVEKLAEGFDWVEGPVWVKDKKEKAGGYLLFSDIPMNSIYKWTEGAGISLFMKPSGCHAGADCAALKEPGSNALTVDKKGNLLMCEHGDRRVARLASLTKPDGKQLPLAAKYDGKRFNSPNDLTIASGGDVFFTDPPYGLVPKDPAKKDTFPGQEQKIQGVYRLDPKGKVTLLHDGLERPNGIALSPDEKTLYVANSHPPRPIWMAFDVKPDHTLANGRVFFDAAALIAKTKRPGMPDGMKVDKQGNLFATGPGGVLIFSPAGKHLGTILTGQATANVAFGDDGSTLYITADSLIARVKTKTVGAAF